MDKALIIFLAVIFAVAGVNGRAQEREQFNENRMRCLASVQQCGVRDIVKEMGEKFPNSAFLEKHCENFISDLSCAVEKLSECDPEQSKIAEKILHLAGRLCDAEDPLSKAYRENVVCLNENLDIIDSCRESVYLTLRGFMRYVLNVNPEEIRQDVGICLPVMTYNACVAGRTQMKCGEETAKLVKVFQEVMEITLIAESCPQDEAQRMKEDIIKFITTKTQEPDIQDLIGRVVDAY